MQSLFDNMFDTYVRIDQVYQGNIDEFDAKIFVIFEDLRKNLINNSNVTGFDEIFQALRADILNYVALKRISAGENAGELVRLLLAPNIDTGNLRGFINNFANHPINRKGLESLTRALASAGVTCRDIERLTMHRDEEPITKYLIEHLD